MKIRTIIPLVLFAGVLCLGGCHRASGGGSGGGGSGGGGGGGDPVTPTGQIAVNFYLDFNKVNEKEVYYTVNVKKGDKLTAPTTPTQAPLPEFPVFLGWSKKEIVDDKKDLWNFSTDTVDTNESVFNIYGIWVAEGEQ